MQTGHNVSRNRTPRGLVVNHGPFKGVLYVGDTHMSPIVRWPTHQTRTTCQIIEVHNTKAIQVRWTREQGQRHPDGPWITLESWENRISAIQQLLETLSTFSGPKLALWNKWPDGVYRSQQPYKALDKWYAQLPKVQLLQPQEAQEAHLRRLHARGWVATPKGYGHPQGAYLTTTPSGSWIAGYSQGERGAFEGAEAKTTIAACVQLLAFARDVGLKPTLAFRNLYAMSHKGLAQIPLAE